MKIFEELKHAALERIPPPPQPEFRFEIGWATSYNALFQEAFHSDSELSILNKAISLGRVLLVGRGGSAKTVVLGRIARSAADQGYLPISIDLKSWSAKDIDEWRISANSLSDRLARLIESAKIARLDFPLFVSLPTSIIKLLIVDGLNELQSSIGEQIIDVLDDAVTGQVSTRVIVSDRLIRRRLRAPHRWALASVLPLSEEEIRRQLSEVPDARTIYENASSEERMLWSSPFFLDEFLKNGDKGESKSSALVAFFSKANLSPDEFDRLSSAAYRLYRHTSSRTFSASEFATEVGEAIVQKLSSSGMIKSDSEGYYYFSHHLMHDYLAARYFKDHSSEWNQAGFDTLSFQASSFDALAIALEQIQDESQAEKFIRALFDWNPYAAAYSLTEQKQATVLSEEMKTVVTAMMAERKFDRIDATRQRAEDALRLMSREFQARYADTKSVADLIRLVKKVKSDREWFSKWQEVYCMLPGDALKRETIKELQSTDSILGWTVANVAKRTDSADQVKYLIGLTRHRRPVVRWRAVHVLGGFPSSRSVLPLLKALDEDNNRWVRFGAVRSLVEMSAEGSSTLRTTIFRALHKRLQQIASDPGIRNELESILLISNVPRRGEWIKAVALLLEKLYSFDTGLDTRDRLEHLARKFRKTYASA